MGCARLNLSYGDTSQHRSARRSEAPDLDAFYGRIEAELADLKLRIEARSLRAAAKALLDKIDL